VKLKNDHAICEIPQCINHKINLLLDTGAELNLIKLNTFQDDVQVSDKKIYNMQGINDKLVNTLGSTVLTVSIDNATYETEFQIVDSTFPIVGDGI